MIMGIMKSFVFKLLLVGFAFAGACACGKTDRVDLEEELDPEVVEIPEVPETPSNPETPVTPVSPEDLYAYVPIRLTSSDMGIRDASNEFGFSVFGKLIKAADGKKDIVFSPLSLSLALSMAAEGAGGETYDQFSSVLGWGEASREEVGAFYAKMIEGLVTADKQVSFTCSNSLWAAKNLDIKEAYAEQLSKSFAAESFSVDFALSETLDRINEWCASKTDGKIQKMLDGLEEQTRMMLINALLFKAPWSVEWQVEKDRPFHGSNATAGKDFLHLDGSFYYRRFEDYEMVGVRYGNGLAYEFVVILPNEGKPVSDIMKSVDSETLRHLSPTPVDLFIPKFSLEYSTGDAFPQCLEELGLKLPFSGVQADFSGISSEKLSISKVIQKARVDVSENGTEFAAVTVIGMDGSAGGEEPKKVVFDANRPFAFIIRETDSNAVLLMGTMSE